ncbi:sialic acid-binding Ig-like lectin 11 [Anguilla rostrata]|uniref:sialic acid-binding Ig-like lectin 11 n=1 Tax=Anguilla rostrata TaxID=7938 RepID=UPI0030CF662E
MISFWAMVLFLIGDSACSSSEMTAKEGSCVTVNLTLSDISNSGYIVWLKDAVWNKTAKDYDGTIVHSLKPDKHNASEFENRVSVCSNGSTQDLYELTISNLRLNDSGKYMVRYYDKADPLNELKKSSTEMSLEVQKNPCQVSVTGPELVQVGAEVILRCSTLGHCQNSPEWRSSGSGPTSSEVSDTQGAKTAQLRFKADWSHDGVEFSCWPSQSNDACTSRNITLTMGDMPQISVSGSCSRTAEEISCSCESHGNPSPSMEWRVSGLRVTNSTDRVIREEQLGNTGLRSSLTMHQSQGDMPTLLCVSTNTLGNSSLQLHLRSPQQHSGFGIISLLIAAAAGAGAMMMICLIMQHILK